MMEIPLKEGGGWSSAYRLTPRQIDATVHGTTDVQHDRVANGQWRFRAHRTAPKVGAIRLGIGEDAVVFRIEPKITITRLMFLVEYAQHDASARWDDKEVAAREEEGLVGAVARAFARAAERALRSGVLNGYHEVESDEMLVRGKIRVGDQIRQRYTLGLPVDLSYDDFTPDIPENRFLLSAARELRQLPELKADVREMLYRIEGLLTGVSPMRAGETWISTRLNLHYHQALNLAELVLRGSSYELDATGGVRADGLLISMSHLYEDFVAVALRRALRRRHGGECRAKGDHFLDIEGSLPAETDLAYYAPGDLGHPGAIIDAKYIVLRGPRGHARNIHQIIAYCYALKAPRGFLVYAQGPESGPIPHRVGDIVITQYPLDLTKPPAELLTQIDALADAIADK